MKPSHYFHRTRNDPLVPARYGAQPDGNVRGLTSRLTRRGAEANRTSDPEALTGKLVDIVAHVANTLAAFGEKLSTGDVIITGSITPPVRSAK